MIEEALECSSVIEGVLDSSSATEGGLERSYATNVSINDSGWTTALVLMTCSSANHLKPKGKSSVSESTPAPLRLSASTTSL